MDKAAFLKDTDVNSFVDWLVGNLPTLPICLRIGKSRFVPTGVIASFTGFGNVINHYMWKSTGMGTGNWTGTMTHLTGLSIALRTAVNAANHANTLIACNNILAWGGNRSRAVGAYPFLHGMATGVLCPYINRAGTAFSLVSADEALLSPPVTRMNAMLTKVHALYAIDGLPIYDSRVAAAIASLVELWRRATSKSGNVLPSALIFPATLTTRTVLRLFPNAIHPGVMVYGALTTPQQWSSAKVRLGWIMEEVLTKLPVLFPPSPHVSIADRMHAFEASLFMIGYDVTCLDCSRSGVLSKVYKKKFKALNSMLPVTKTWSKSITPLFRPGKVIVYSGGFSSGFDVQWGGVKFFIEPEFLENLLGNFSGVKKVPLGAGMTGIVPATSLGQWIFDNGWPSRRYASAIAAILCNEGYPTKSTTKNCLDF